MTRCKQTACSGVSYIKNPKNNTTMYVGKKFEHLVSHLSEAQDCLLFFEDGMNIPQSILDNNSCHFSPVPVRDFALAVKDLWEQQQAEMDTLPRVSQDGATIGSNVQLGENVIIEPSAFIDHHVKIGDGTRICAGAIIRNGTTIGKNCLIREGAVIGSEGFTMAPDTEGKPFRLHCLAGVELADEVEVGANTTIARGQSRDTYVDRLTKIDDQCYLAHDVYLGKQITVTSGVTLGGFVEIGDKSYLGMNCTVKQLLTIGSGSTIGMGAVVTKPIPDGVIAFGSPARIK